MRSKLVCPLFDYGLADSIHNAHSANLSGNQRSFSSLPINTLHSPQHGDSCLCSINFAIRRRPGLK